MRKENREYTEKYKAKINNRCPICNKLIAPQAKFCAVHRPHDGTKGRVGSNACAWKGGRTKHPTGYVSVYAYGYPGNRAFEHRLVWENANGQLPKGWRVHHINGIKDDNRLENLIALPNKSHIHSSPTKLLLKKAQARIKELEAHLNKYPPFFNNHS